MGKYQDVRSIPLGSVLASLGFLGFKKRPGKKKHNGKCPFHQPKKNNTSFLFTDEKFNCFSCGEHGGGAIDLVLKKIGFQKAVYLVGSKTLKLYGVGQYFNPSRKSAYSNKVLFSIQHFSDGVKVGYLSTHRAERSGLALSASVPCPYCSQLTYAVPPPLKKCLA